ncbi:hypothetical protein BDW62DRAFT_184699, partial [Aspergillus aurantiobrunneus]
MGLPPRMVLARNPGHQLRVCSTAVSLSSREPSGSKSVLIWKIRCRPYYLRNCLSWEVQLLSSSRTCPIHPCHYLLQWFLSFVCHIPRSALVDCRLKKARQKASSDVFSRFLLYNS